MKKLLLLLIILIFIPIFFIDFGRDASVFGYMGRLIVNGYIPYIDGWDHKGISLYFINALGYLIGFKSLIGIRILELILILYSFSKIYSILSVRYTKVIALIACIIGLFTLKYFFDGGNMTEEYGAIFTLIAVSLLLKEKLKSIEYAIIGALFVINLTIRANLISFWIALFLMYCFQVIIKSITLRSFFMNLLKMAYGAISVIAFLLIYFIFNDSFQEFIDAAFVFNLSYTNTTFLSTLEAVFRSMTRYHLSIILIIAFVVSLLRIYKDRTKKIELLLIVWIPLELFFSNVSNRMYAHYFMMWTPMLILSFCVILSTLKEQLKTSNQKIIILSTIIFSVCFYVPSYVILKEWKEVFIKPNTTKIKKIGIYIEEHYKEYSLLVWGNACQLYNDADKKAPTTYFYQSIFKYKSDLIKRNAIDFTKEILANKPELIIDTKQLGLLNLNGLDEIEIDKSQELYLKEFLSIVQTYYILKEVKFGVEFYTLKRNE